MREPFVKLRRDFISDIKSASPIAKNNFIALGKLRKVQPYFLAALRKLEIIVERDNTVIWDVGDINDDLLNNIIDVEEQLIRLGKGKKISKRDENPLAKYADKVLLDELKSRGFEGSISKRINFEL